MATTSLNIVQRLGGPTLTTLCATFLDWRLAALHSEANLARAFIAAFILLSVFHPLLCVATFRLPLTIVKAKDQPLEKSSPAFAQALAD
jgi:hypothetical protein